MTTIQNLHELAKSARLNAYAPYSKCLIGAAILLESGKTYAGCNVENASYGATICAERVAVCKAQSENKNIKITEILVLSDAPAPWPPCGMCRQVLAEFATAETKVHIANLEKVHRTMTFAELFPESFSRSHLLD